MRAWPIATLASLALAACAAPPAGDAPRPDGGGGAPQRLRVMTFNIEDARTGAIASGEDERLRRVGAVVRALRPDVLLINEIAADPGLENARRFVDAYVAPPPEYDVLMLPSNTGEHSGLDLDRNGRVDPEPGSRDYAGDCFGWGEFPGQYAMALLVRRGLEIDRERVRTFRALRWADMPGALLPPGPGGEGSWYDDDELAVFRLSSKSHWDVPIRLENGATLHALCSHPTPPVFDGDEDRNGRRNHDEIRFWADYLDGADWIVDDGGARGGLAPDALFVLLGDLNADPAGGSGLDPMGRRLLAHPRVNGAFVPRSDVPVDGLDATDTAGFRLRVDYALPSVGLAVRGGSVVRRAPGGGDWPSDHFAVYVDLIVPAP